MIHDGIDAAQIADLYKTGISGPEIASVLGIPKKWVYAALTRAGMATRRPPPKDVPVGINRVRGKFGAWIGRAYVGIYDTLEEALAARDLTQKTGRFPARRYAVRSKPAARPITPPAPALVTEQHPDRATINVAAIGGFGSSVVFVPVSVARVRFLERPSA